MKNTIWILLATLAAGTIANAAPKLLVETSISGPNDIGGTAQYMAPRSTVKSGERLAVKMGEEIKYTIIPTLLENGRVRLEVHLISASVANANVEAPPVTTKLGYAVPVCAGQWQFSTKTTLAN